MEEIQLTDLKRESASIQSETMNAIADVVAQADYILGKDLENFEDRFAKYCGAEYCVGVANGTAALFLSLVALGIGTGDEVITTTISFAATAEAIAWTGAKPRFVDVDSKNLSIDLEKIEGVITEKTKAILPVYLYGYPVDIDQMRALCKKYGLYLIGDCAQAHGARYKGKNIGGQEDVACFSFMPAKNLGAYGDAGCIVTNDRELSDRIRQLRDHGRSSKHKHELLGYAERMDNLQAAVLNVKIDYLEGWNARRREIADRYRKKFKDVKTVTTLTPVVDTDPCYHQFVIIVRGRDKLRDRLLEHGVRTGLHYPVPLHLQPCFAYLGYEEGDFPVAESLSKQIISLPMHPFLTDEEVDYVGDLVVQYA